MRLPSSPYYRHGKFVMMPEVSPSVVAQKGCNNGAKVGRITAGDYEDQGGTRAQ